jgi:hypothetical protein
MPKTTKRPPDEIWIAVENKVPLSASIHRSRLDVFWWIRTVSIERLRAQRKNATRTNLLKAYAAYEIWPIIALAVDVTDKNKIWNLARLQTLDPKPGDDFDE